MQFTETKLKGAFLVAMTKIEDHRGFFARGWCSDEFAAHNLVPTMVQLNVGFNSKKGTLRGLHYQDPPNQEAKFIRCTRGAIYDVIVDLRPGSLTRHQWFGVELSHVNALMLYAPEGFAHGYETLTDDAEMYYLTSARYAAASARGVRYNDPTFGIAWPIPLPVISDADNTWPDYVPETTSRD